MDTPVPLVNAAGVIVHGRVMAITVVDVVGTGGERGRRCRLMLQWRWVGLRCGWKRRVALSPLRTGVSQYIGG